MTSCPPAVVADHLRPRRFTAGATIIRIHHSTRLAARGRGSLAGRHVLPRSLIIATGGEEFALFLKDANEAHATVIANRLCTRIASLPVGASVLRIPVTISLGVVECDPSVDTVQSILHKADTALLQAKRNGRNRVEVYRSTAAVLPMQMPMA